MTPATGALGAAVAMALTACGAARAPAASAAPPTASAPDGALLGPAPRAEIDTLDRQIAADLATLALAPAATPACAATGCTTAPAPLSLPPRASDAMCRPAATERCTDACRLADAICTSAGRICQLADQLGGADPYANERCARGQDSCTRSRTHCCGCA